MSASGTARAVAVAVPAPLYTAFDYEVPAGWAPRPGMRVQVPFGRRSAVGVVLEEPREVPLAERRLRPLAQLLDDAPLLTAEVLELARWCAAYYQHPVGESVATCLPGPLRGGAPAALATRRAWQLTPAGAAALAQIPPRARAQRALIERLAAGPAEELPEALAATARIAMARGWVERTELEDAPVAAADPASAPSLTPEQADALAQLRKGDGFQVDVLDGVTGSGKTELYLQRAADVVAAGGQVLVLAPEIGLTPQLAGRFAQRFGARVERYHSAMAEGERAQAWLRARAGRCAVVVGTRSAVFVPFARLGLVVVDEEHDTSFKQQEGLRYSARDVAVMRARRLGVPVILGSATPSLETLANVQAQRYRHVRLTRRVHTIAPPAIRLLDLRGQRLKEGLSAPLLQAIGRHLGAGGQALLFINRRGFAPVLLCHDCGWQMPCPNCDARMTLHRARARMVCHHCAAQAPVPVKCGACASGVLVPVGQGTERIEEALHAEFPGKRIERFDSDRIRRRGELERLLDDIRSGDVHVLVGTQMLAKGHDFAGLSLVGILNVDQALYGADFRALERMGQLVTQVSGRAGRGTQPGEVLLQTHEPQHPALHELLRAGYGAFCDTLLAQRRTLGLPPFGHLALLRADAPSAAQAQAFLADARRALPGAQGFSALGPVPAPMERLGGRFRAQLLLRSASRSLLQRTLSAAVPGLDALPSARAVRWSVDVDPADLF
ncbi:MAG TPA: primosomal protein N' [Candidatus Binatia bacterium]|nr:primosomal protein N' [Candidatus Binatia bacterium]